MRPILRLCLDLNVWVADLRGRRAGRVGTVSQELVDAVARGTSALGPVQLVVSWGMLDWLRVVLVREVDMPRFQADQVISAIVHAARAGPGAEAPLLTLGGAGVMPLRDAEDAHVLETAVAGDAHVVATANHRDFLPRHASVRVAEPAGFVAVVPGRAGDELVVADPRVVWRWMREGSVELSGAPVERLRPFVRRGPA